MKIGIILTTKEYEKAWNAFRFAVAAKTQNNEVKIFLLGDAVECEGLTHEKFNINEHLKAFISFGGEVLACGTCLETRQRKATETYPFATMADCVKMVEWADKVLTF